MYPTGSLSKPIAQVMDPRLRGGDEGWGLSLIGAAVQSLNIKAGMHGTAAAPVHTRYFALLFLPRIKLTPKNPANNNAASAALMAVQCDLGCSGVEALGSRNKGPFSVR